MNLFDKNGFYYAPYATLKMLMIKEMKEEPTFDQVVQTSRDIAKTARYDTFPRFAIEKSGVFGGDTNLHLMMFHTFRFFQDGAITYKIRKEKVDFLKDITLSIPANLLVLPFNEFMISVPSGAIVTSQGNLLNIYVSQEPFVESNYNDQYEVEPNVMELIKSNKIKRIIRCYGISYKDNEETGVTNYYQFPIIEDQDVAEQFNKLIDSAAHKYNKDTTKAMFNFMLNFCAYLSVPNADVAKVLGVTKRPTKVGSKKWRNAERQNLVESYNYFDVGRIYAERCHSDSVSHQETGRFVRMHKVRRHLRAQWYGEKKDGALGTEQKVILIEEFWKGDLEDGFKPKIVEVA